MTPTATKTLTELLDEGLDYVAKGGMDEAQDAFLALVKKAEKASILSAGDVEILSQARNQLGIMALNAGRAEEALSYLDAATGGSALDTVVEANRGMALMKLSRWMDAARAFGRVLAKNPGMSQSRFQLGRCFYMEKQHDKAVETFRTCLEQMPSWPDARLELGLALAAMGNKDEAEAEFQKIRKGDTSFFQEIFKQAQILKDKHYEAEAADIIGRAAMIMPDDPAAHYQLGIFYQELGDRVKAEKYFKSSLAIMPSHLTYGQLAAFYEKANDLNNAWATAQLGLQKFPDDPYMELTIARCERRAKKYDQALERLVILTPKVNDPILKTQMLFQLGWLYDVKDDIDAAYGSYVKGKKLAAETADSSKGDKTSSQKYIDAMTKLDFSRLPKIPYHPGPGEPKNIAFLVGFPRSGTTLLNQILDSHPQLVGIEEKPTIPGPFLVVDKLAGGYPKALEGLSEDAVQLSRERYFLRLRDFADFDENSVVIDKLPLNLVHLPMIWAMFPDAKIILALRHPMGCSLSCFMHNFRLNNAMANMFSLDDITRYYTEIMGLWRHFEKNTDYGHHPIKYEDVVRDIEGEARRLCDYLDVDWSEEMLQYARHARAKGLINTPSYHQVVQPLYSESLERWRRYDKCLMPYKDRLEPFIKHFGYSFDE